MKPRIKRTAALCLMFFSATSATTFAEDAYIESTGTQAISLGRKMTPATRWEVDFALTDSATTQQRIFGVSTGNGQLALYVNGEGKWSFGAKAGGYPTTIIADETRHLAIGDAETGKGCIVTDGVTNGVSASTFSVDEDSDYPLAVFGYASNAGGTAFGNHAKARVYGFRVWENGTLVMRGVPAIKNGLPCFRDTVGGGFYFNGVPGTVLGYGGDIEQHDPYIRATGAQFIDTGYCAKTTSRFELDYELEPDNAAVASGGNVQARLFSASEKGAVTTVYVAGTAGGNDANIAFSCGDSWQSAWTGKGFDSKRRTVVLDVANSKGHLVEQGVETSSKDLGAMTADSGKTLRLFSMVGDNERKGYNLVKMKVFAFRILESGTVVRDYRPAVRDGVAGLLDTIGGGFLAPAPMGRPFLYGGPIDSDGSDGACLVSNGDQIINTSLIPKLTTRIEVDFALNSHTSKQERVFGATRATDSVFGLYCNGEIHGAGDFSIAAGDVGGGFPGYDTGVGVDLKRHTAVIDFKNAKMHFITGSETNFTHDIENSVNTPTWIMGLFGEPYTADFSGTDNRADMRLYAARVYNDDKLVQHWLPYKDPVRIGLKDVVTGTIRTNGRTAAVPFEVEGCGWGENREPFFDAPDDQEIKFNETVALSAFAPGAIAYCWMLDGIAAEGANGTAFDIAWKKTRTPVSVSVGASFRVGDGVEYREAAATLSMTPEKGLTLIFR